MGVERAVTRWYMRRQLLLDEIKLLQTKIAPSATADGATPHPVDVATQEKLVQAQAKLRVLGACPRPMMG